MRSVCSYANPLRRSLRGQCACDQAHPKIQLKNITKYLPISIILMFNKREIQKFISYELLKH